MDEIYQQKGSLGKQNKEDKLMSSVLQSEKQTIDNGKLLNEAINKGIMSFSPDLMMSHLAKNYQMAENLYGETILKLISGYHPDYLRKNINIPEFKREIAKIIKENIDALKKEGILDKDGMITEYGYENASYALYMEELENLVPTGHFGQRVHKKLAHYGDKGDTRPYKPGDRFKDFAAKHSIKLAIRRGHKTLESVDLRSFDRQKRGEVSVIYALDSSGSMKGKKLEAAKKAGVALAYQAISKDDKAGLIVFGSEITNTVAPTKNFKEILHEITRVRAKKETEFAPMIRKAIELFPSSHGTKHLVALTDAMPTVGDDPTKEALNAVGEARNHGITISIVGIGLDKKGEKLARDMATLGEGRLIKVTNLQDMDKMVLEDYYSIR